MDPFTFRSSKPGNRDFEYFAPRKRQKLGLSCVTLNDIFDNPLK